MDSSDISRIIDDKISSVGLSLSEYEKIKSELGKIDSGWGKVVFMCCMMFHVSVDELSLKWCSYAAIDARDMACAIARGNLKWSPYRISQMTGYNQDSVSFRIRRAKNKIRSNEMFRMKYECVVKTIFENGQ